ncbi:MAG: hypothetical protein ACREEV_16935 [Dongiaceae bacterium]
MKTLIRIGVIASVVALQVAAAHAQECMTFTSGEVLCDDGAYAYYWSPATQEWLVLDREATAAALGTSTGPSYEDSSTSGGSTVYGSDGSLTSTDDGCTMFSSPGYSYGESFSFSSGC